MSQDLAEIGPDDGEALIIRCKNFGHFDKKCVGGTLCMISISKSPSSNFFFLFY